MEREFLEWRSRHWHDGFIANCEEKKPYKRHRASCFSFRAPYTWKYGKICYALDGSADWPERG
jgi:hypothetical protein